MLNHENLNSLSSCNKYAQGSSCLGRQVVRDASVNLSSESLSTKELAYT